MLLRDGAQETTGTVAVVRDVTKRYEEVRELKRRLAGAKRPRKINYPEDVVLRSSRSTGCRRSSRSKGAMKCSTC